MQKPKLTVQQRKTFLTLLQDRFEKNKKRHKSLEWNQVADRLEKFPDKLLSLHMMEESGGEPDVVDHDAKTGAVVFMDCAAESPLGRRSLCYDREALDSRKENKPKDNVIDMVQQMGIELLTEKDYRYLQKLGTFDAKTSSWIMTPDPIRKLGGALFGDFRYGTVFVYHNGAQSYYAARGFRGLLRV
ncbi:MAG: hypothetical protein RIR96_713 [Bacteroidota bacterium]|jgi:hypothetical protein